MYSSFVPMDLRTLPSQVDSPVISAIIEDLKSTNTEKVFLCGIGDHNGFDNLEPLLKKVENLLPVFRNNQIDACVWISSIHHVLYPKQDFIKKVDLSGDVHTGLVCPSDERFIDFFSDVLIRISEAGVKSIVLDDDFRMNTNGCKPLCFCKNHLDFIRKKLGRDITLDEIQEKLLTGGPNAIRDAWLDANSFFLTNFAKKVRENLDKEHPDVNLILCSGPASWGVDGSSVPTITKAFAGNNETLVRLSGAPYWKFFFPTMNLANCIDYARNQAAFLKRQGIYSFAEGDSYPRPRYALSSSRLELYDIAQRVDGNTNGILKYVYDYVAPYGYENGYVKAWQKNLPLYACIDKMFSGKNLEGINVFEPFTLVKDIICHESDKYMDVETRGVESPAIRLLNDISIPTKFDHNGVSMVFGGYAKELPDSMLGQGLFLDINSAKILMDRGIDIGINSINGLFGQSKNSHFLLHLNPFLYRYKDSFSPCNELVLYDITPKDGAKILSTYDHNGKTCTGEFFYENNDGQRFFIFPFDAYDQRIKQGAFRSYLRQQEILDAYKLLSGHSLPAECTGNPDLYMIEKSSEKSLSVGLFNFSEDAIDEPEIILNDKYNSIETLNCSGSLEGNKVHLSKLHAFEFAAFEVKKA